MSRARIAIGSLLACLAALAAGMAIVRARSDSALASASVDTSPAFARPQWTADTQRQLLHAIDASRDEGLRPQDYRRGALAHSIETNPSGPEVDALAMDAARALAHDYADGRIVNRRRFDWHIEKSPAPLVTMDADLTRAINDGRLDAYLRGLLPRDRRYTALREALENTPPDQTARITAIRASMERWRWMPRVLGTDYLWVNVPTYRVALYRGNIVAAMHDVVVGAPRTPTPMLSAHVGSIIANPWWTLPPTVLHEGKRYSLARGYVYQTIRGRTYVRQKPGPMNALGRMKIDMPNAWAIYLHDTPSKGGFLKTDRALSHGCIRVKDITTLAERLYDPSVIDSALQTYRTRTLPMEKSVPVYIVYFTAAPDADGKVETYSDVYGLDGALVAALDRGDIASATKATYAP
jgi:murein L,D-transpeptidase YcbB/YkuD